MNFCRFLRLIDVIVTLALKRQFFLADRTNGRAYATVLRLSDCLSVVVCL